MKKLIVLLILAFNILSGYSRQFTDIEEHIFYREGYATEPYRDKHGFWHVGIGHQFPKKELASYKNLTGPQIIDLFINDVEIATKAAKRQVTNFNQLHPEAQTIVIALAFNLGEKGLSRFKKFRRALNESDYQCAAYELKNSLWYGQVGKRGEDYVKILIDIGEN